MAGIIGKIGRAIIIAFKNENNPASNKMEAAAA